MPSYEYRCSTCQEITSLVCAMADKPETVACEHCGATARKIVTKVATRLSNTSKMEKLDPKYDKMVDAAMRKTTSADPDKYLKKMRPFKDASD